MFEKVYQQHWINLPIQTRNYLASKFNIVRTGVTEVRDQTVVSDGFTNQDLSVITKDNLLAFTGEPLTSSFSHLWDTTIRKIHDEIFPVLEENYETVEPVPVVPKYCNFCVSTKGRHRKGCPKFK